jgi:HK97 family phage prohead protease
VDTVADEVRSIGSFGADGRTLIGTSPYSVPAFIPTLQMWEQFEPGVFAESIATDDIRMLVEHLPDPVLGRTVSRTLRLFEGAGGLHVEAHLPETQAADDLLTSVKRGDKTGLSARFKALVERFERRSDGSTLRRIFKARLLDLSVVTFPAYPDATVAAGTMTTHAELATAAARRQHEALGAEVATAAARRQHEALAAFLGL